MKNKLLSTGLLLIAVLLLAACQVELPAAPPAAPVEAPEDALPVTGVQEEPEQSAAGVTLTLARDADLGEFLVDQDGMTLYMFARDEPGQSNCDAGCLAAWPPLLADAPVSAGQGVDAALIGEGQMLDGRAIVTYNDMPLYYWVQDMAPGDTTGQGFGGVWFVVSPDGRPVGQDVTPAADPGQEAVVVNAYNHSRHGRILVDEEGMTLYMFTVDEPDKVNCAGECLAAWPPLVTESAVTAGEGVNPNLLGTAEMDDGRLIVTYNRMPLYYWVGDTKAGDTNGQDVNNVWFVVSTTGKPVGVKTESDSGYDSYSPDY